MSKLFKLHFTFYNFYNPLWNLKKFLPEHNMTSIITMHTIDKAHTNLTNALQFFNKKKGKKIK